MGQAPVPQNPDRYYRVPNAELAVGEEVIWVTKMLTRVAAALGSLLALLVAGGAPFRA